MLLALKGKTLLYNMKRYQVNCCSRVVGACVLIDCRIVDEACDTQRVFW